MRNLPPGSRSGAESSFEVVQASTQVVDVLVQSWRDKWSTVISRSMAAKPLRPPIVGVDKAEVLADPSEEGGFAHIWTISVTVQFPREDPQSATQTRDR